jgi:elongation factor 1-gamma
LYRQFHTTSLERLTTSLTTLEKHLATRTFLATERITLADITLAAELQQAFAFNIDAALRSKLPNILRHFETIVNQPSLTGIFGETTFTEKAAQYAPPAKEKKEKKEEAPKPKVEKKPKKEEVDDEEDDDRPVEEPKAKNPLDFLPKSPFNLEDWKRAYSNKDTRGADGSLEWFYAKCVHAFLPPGLICSPPRLVCPASTRRASPSGASTSSTTASSP